MVILFTVNNNCLPLIEIFTVNNINSPLVKLFTVVNNYLLLIKILTVNKMPLTVNNISLTSDKTIKSHLAVLIAHKKYVA